LPCILQYKLADVQSCQPVIYLHPNALLFANQLHPFPPHPSLITLSCTVPISTTRCQTSMQQRYICPWTCPGRQSPTASHLFIPLRPQSTSPEPRSIPQTTQTGKPFTIPLLCQHSHLI
jgi:hypothetical protein